MNRVSGEINAQSSEGALGRQVSLGYALAVIMLTVVGAISYRSINRFMVDSFWSRHTYDVLAAVQAVHETVLDAESYVRAYVATGNQQALESARAKIAMIDPKVSVLKTLTSDNPVQQRRIELLRPLLAKKNDVMNRQCLYRQSPSFNAASAMAATGTGGADEMRSVLDDMEREENQLLVRRRLETESSGRGAIRLIVAGAIATLFLLAAGGWMIHGTIAARARSEAAVRASDTMFRGLLEAAPDAMVIVNENGDIEFFSAQAETMFGYTTAELRGQSIERIIPERYRAGHNAQRESFFAAPGMRRIDAERELFGLRKDGTEIPVEISLSPLRTPLGLRVSSAFRDITRRRQEEESLKELNTVLTARTAQLEVANKELESFSYSVSHDLRAPLRSIDGFSQALLEDNEGKLDAESADNLRRVRAASQKMGHLIDDLLNLARVSRSEMSRESIDVSKLAREVVEELQDRNPAPNVQINIQDGLSDQGDPRLLRVVLTNLLGNALKFTATQPNPRIEFGAVGDSGAPEYFVRDNGVGFEMAYVGKLFGAFQRLHAATEFPGTGIGLATVQRIVHRHGGRVWADGQLQGGATFRFTLSPQGEATHWPKAA